MIESPAFPPRSHLAYDDRTLIATLQFDAVGDHIGRMALTANDLAPVVLADELEGSVISRYGVSSAAALAAITYEIDDARAIWQESREVREIRGDRPDNLLAQAAACLSRAKAHADEAGWCLVTDFGTYLSWGPGGPCLATYATLLVVPFGLVDAVCGATGSSASNETLLGSPSCH